MTEVSVIDASQNNMVVAKMELEIEPGFVHLGPLHFAVGMNSSIWYYRWRDVMMESEMKASATLVCKRDYFGTIK